jgi:hypothetical protein
MVFMRREFLVLATLQLLMMKRHMEMRVGCRQAGIDGNDIGPIPDEDAAEILAEMEAAGTQGSFFHSS